MVHSTLLAAVAASVLLSTPACAQSMYTKNSPVLQVNAKNYDSLINKSNYTSIVEFYAPWCGHCKNLKPAYEKAATHLKGLAKVAAIDCDEDANKPLCGSMGVQGFPTLKIIKPGKKAGKPMVEDYQGQRQAKAIVEAVIDKIPNHVKKLSDSDFESWVEAGGAPKAILFSEKGVVGPLLKALAIDFLGGIEFAQIKNKEAKAVEKFEITKFPTLVVLPGGDQEALTYSGEMKKEPLVKFLSQVTSPNPDPAPTEPKKKSTKKASTSKEAKSSKSKASKSSSSASSAFSKASASHASSESASAATESSASTPSASLESETNQPTESPLPIVEDQSTPIEVPVTPKPEEIPTIPSFPELIQDCLTDATTTCILALLPYKIDFAGLSPTVSSALDGLASIRSKQKARGAKTVPFWVVAPGNEGHAFLREKLDLSFGSDGTGVEILAINTKRGWYNRYNPNFAPSGTSGSNRASDRPKQTLYSEAALEDWVDGIKLGDFKKSKVPAEVVHESWPGPTFGVDENTPEGVKEGLEFDIEKLKAQLPEGLKVEMVEEVDDEGKATRGHDEL